MNDAVIGTRFSFFNQKSFYKGKVRDVYNIDDKYIIIVVTDRISAFDVVLPKAIPFKGQVLNQIASKFLDATKDIVPNWKISSPDPMVTVGYFIEPFKVEMVVRAYLTGHAWREYKSGKREICGVALPEGMKEHDKFDKPIITPTTKEDVGHDQDISKEEIVKRNIVSQKDYEKLETYSLELFRRGTKLADDKGLILVDTKYEFGKKDNQIFLIDEIHTPDSSRYFYSEGYEERQNKGQAQRQLSKEFVRQWLIENNFQGKDGQKIPEMTYEIIKDTSERYIELYESIIGEKFIKDNINSVEERIKKNINRFLKRV
ncbi:MAG: phosphoribosylaminoimidazolesuccinocarboxamide synthase [Bacteroidetes bacterium]|nr:phosphoribosylaminoimidazolesuccinocarboxamide synthase [Bacteroidota bacterium]